MSTDPPEEPPAKRTRRSIALTQVSNVDKTTLNVPKTKAKTRGKAVKMDSHRTVEDSEPRSEQTKPAKSARGKYIKPENQFHQE